MSILAAKPKHIEAQVDPDTEARIAAAAELRHESVSASMIRAALAEADRVLERPVDVTIMPADVFDEFMATIDEPDEAPNLARAAARYRRLIGE